MPRTISKILIANRGEIACRIIRTCQRLGIDTVAVYSSVDRYARHVALADAAECIGPPAPEKSYLNSDAILAAAKKHAVDAIHPGYGFLAENADFAQACADDGLIFIGAPVAAMRLMASKSAAKNTLQAAGVPVVPGYHGDNQGSDVLFREAEKIGWPVLIKAVAGGGGKGMKVVHNADEFHEALASAKNEARKAFGDDRVILEKFITRPRHLEVQIFSDQHGQHVHLFERDCSAQRRYQKIIEEAPAAGLPAKTREAMLQAALKVAKAVDYAGAGTVEFILDADNRFYFLEMNTRLQVEHRVTELITGTDLVAWQIQVAEGRPLPLSQDAIACCGHAIEARVYAEDPDNDFLPSVGVLDRVQFPPHQSGRLLVDSGVRQADRISVYYDPMIAKLVVWGETRENAIAAMNQALAETLISGVKTNLASLGEVLNNPLFLDNCLYTNAIDQGVLDGDTMDEMPLPHFMAAIIAHQLHAFDDSAMASEAAPIAWALFGPDWRPLTLRHQDRLLQIAYRIANETLFIRSLAQTILSEDGQAEPLTDLTGRFSWPLDWDFKVHEAPEAYHVIIGHHRQVFEKQRHDSVAQADGDARLVLAPMPGELLQVFVKPGEKVEQGQTLAVMEAMKMELSLKAPRSACIDTVHHRPGDILQAGDVIFTLKPDESDVDSLQGEAS